MGGRRAHRRHIGEPERQVGRSSAASSVPSSSVRLASKASLTSTPSPSAGDHVVLVLYPLSIPFDKLANGEGFLPQLEWDESAGNSSSSGTCASIRHALLSTWRAPASLGLPRGQRYNEGGLIT